MSKGPEAKVKDAIKKVLNEHGCYYTMPPSGPYGKQGIPDILGHYKGVFFAIEVKAPGKLYNVSANQQAHIDEIKEKGGVAIVADGTGIVEEMLKEIHIGYDQFD